MSATERSKVPIRGISKALTRLSPGIRAKLESAFIEAESQLDFHNTSTAGNATKKAKKAKVKAPVLSVKTNTLGFDLNWPKLKDRTISNYEIQISPASNFSSYISYNTVDNSFDLEGATFISYARVRGVLWNGDAGPWSNTQKIDVTAAPAGPVVYSKTISNLSSFYINYPGLIYPSPLQEITITAKRREGGIMVFGSMGVEFYVDANGFRGRQADLMYLGSNKTPEDSINLVINGKRVHGLTFLPCFQAPGRAPIVSPPQSTVFGYSAGFGPAYLTHQRFYSSEYDFAHPYNVGELNDSTPLGIHTGWLGKRNVENEVLIIEEGFGQFVKIDGHAKYTIDNTADIPIFTQVAAKTLKTNNYKFNIPSTDTILGIKLDLFISKFSDGGPFNFLNIKSVKLINDDGVPRSFVAGSGIQWVSQQSEFAGDTGGPDITLGGPTDLWGEAAGFWTPNKINNHNFGADIQAQSRYGGVAGFFSTFGLRGLHFTVYTKQIGDGTADIKLQYKPRTNDFYTYPYTRAVLKNCTINVLEFGKSSI